MNEHQSVTALGDNATMNQTNHTDPDPTEPQTRSAEAEELASADPADAPAIAEAIADELGEVLENTDRESGGETL